MTTRHGGTPIVLARTVRIVLALGLLAALATAGAHPSAAQGTGPRLQLLSQTPFVETPGVLVLQLAVNGPPAAAPLAVTIDRYDDISNSADPRGRLDTWIAEPSRSKGNEQVTRELPDTGDVQIPIGRDKKAPPPGGFAITDAGVFPLVIRLQTADGRELDQIRTFLIVPGATARDEPPLKVGAVLGLRAPVALKPDGTRQLSDDDRARLDAAQKVLNAHPQAKLTVDPQPETIAALDGRSPALNAGTLRSAIDRRQVLSSTWVDIDIGRFIDAGLRDQVERLRQFGLEGLAPLLDRAQQPTGADPGTLVARHPLGADARAALQTTAPAPVGQLVVPARSVRALDGRAAGADAGLQPFDLAYPGGRSRAILGDERLADRLKTPGDPAVAAQATLADLAILACGSKTTVHCNNLPKVARSVALVVPDDRQAIVAFGRVLDALGTPNRLMEVTDLRGAFAVPPATGTRNEPLVRDDDSGLRGPNADAGLGDFPERLVETAHQVNVYRSMLVPPPVADPGAPPAPATDPPPTDRADKLLQLLDVAGATNAPGGAKAYLDDVTRQVGAALGGVRAPAQKPITLASSDGVVQVQVENALDHPVAVRVQLSSDKPLFDGGRTTTTTLDALLPAAADPGTPSTSSVPVPVNVVSSGKFTIDTRVVTPDEAMVLSTTKIEVRSTVVSWVGLVLTVAAGLFLVIWWARHFRDARRARKLVQVEDVDEAVAIATGEVPVVGNAEVGERV